MKKFILIALLAVMLSGCVKKEPIEIPSTSSKTSSSIEGLISSDLSSEASSSENISNENISSEIVSSEKTVSSNAASSDRNNSKPEDKKAVSSTASSKADTKDTLSEASSETSGASGASETNGTSSNKEQPPQVSSEATVNSTYSASGYYEIENTIFEKINELRLSVGEAPLVKNDALTLTAYIRSKEMYDNNYFEHARPDGSGYDTAFAEGGYNDWKRVCENIGKTVNVSLSEVANVLFESWKNSPSHYEAMVSPNYSEVGISIYTDGTIVYSTQSFGFPH